MPRAIVVVDKGEVAIQDVSLPSLKDDWLIVQVKAIALNPSDWKHIDFGGADTGARVGCDYAGVVHSVGKNVTRFKVGDRTAGAVHGSNRVNHDCGAFGEYITGKAALQMHIPDHMPFEAAATLGVATITIALGLYMELKLPRPIAPKIAQSLLVHGGSTVVGMYSIQWAKASGLTVLATASPHNFDLLKSLGADGVFDYRSETFSQDIKAAVPELSMVFDCVGGTGVGAALGENLARYVMIAPLESKLPANVDSEFILGYDAWGEGYIFRGEVKPVRKNCFDFASKFAVLAEKLFEERVIRVVNYTVNRGGSGLEGAIRGLDVLRAGVSATKLVYTL